METVYLFDIDGTLTPARQPFDPDFETFFLEFCHHHDVYLVTGSDRPKADEQVSPAVRDAVRGLFTCSAAEFWIDDRLVFQLHHEFPETLVKALWDFVNSSSYPHRYGHHLEFRTGMINVSVPGRNATWQERLDYHHWDLVVGERRSLINSLLSNFSDYDATAGGEISIDVTPRGWNKSKALSTLRHSHPRASFVFFGDRVEKGGNDWPLACALETDSTHNVTYKVNGFKETQEVLEEIIRNRHWQFQGIGGRYSQTAVLDQLSLFR